MFFQVVIFLLGYIASTPISERTGLAPSIMVLAIGLFSFAIYLLPSSHSGSTTRINPIPGYWNTRISALAHMRLVAQTEKEPLKTIAWRNYLYGLETNYEAALLEGREALAKRFRELIEKYEHKVEED